MATIASLDQKPESGTIPESERPAITMTTNVIGELGDPDARETVIFVAHHDAANAGLIFHPGPTRLVADAFPDWYGRQETSPPLMQLVVAGPLLAGAGALLGRRRLRRAGGAAALLAALVVGEIAARRVVPGANDNLAAVAVLLELARVLQAQPAEDVRVILLSTGAEESFMKGMRPFFQVPKRVPGNARGGDAASSS